MLKIHDDRLTDWFTDHHRTHKQFCDTPREKYVSQQASMTRTMWTVDARHWHADHIIGSSRTLIAEESIHCSATCRRQDAASPCAGPQWFNTLSSSTQSADDDALWVTGSTTAHHNIHTMPQ